MPESGPAEGSSSGYIRGAAGLPTSNAQVWRASAVVALLCLAGVTAALLVGSVHQYRRDHGLASHGVPVAVKITNCVGTATGTGIQVLGFTCRGSFTFGGRQYIDTIVGQSQAFNAGTVVPGVVDPRSPSVLHSASAVAHTQSAARIFGRPVVAGVVTLLVALVMLAWPRGHGRRRLPAT